MDRARFVTQTIDFAMIGHNAPFQVGILFHSPLFCLCLSVVCNLLHLGNFFFPFLILLSAFLQSFLNINKLS